MTRLASEPRTWRRVSSAAIAAAATAVFVQSLVTACGGQIDERAATTTTTGGPLACMASKCVPQVVLGNIHASALAVDEHDLYFADPVAGTIVKAPLSAPANGSVLATNVFGVRGIALGPLGDIYLARTEVTDSPTLHGSVEVLPADGGARRTIAQSPPWYAIALALDGTDILLADFQSTEIRRIAIADGSVSVARNTPSTNTTGVAVWHGAIVWSEGNVEQRVLSGATDPPTVLGGASERHPTGVVVDGDYAFWTAFGGTWSGGSDGAVSVTPLAGGAPAKVVDAIGPFSLCVTSRGIYWLEMTRAETSFDPVPVNVMFIAR